MNKLRLAVMGNNGKNLDDLPQMDGKIWQTNDLNTNQTKTFRSEFVHTSDLESLNSLLLKYANKTYVYRFRNYDFFTIVTVVFLVGLGCWSGAVLLP